MADGCVGTNGTLRVTLNAADAGHLRRLQAFLGTDRPLYKNGATCVQLHVSSQRLTNDLVGLGIIPLKSSVCTYAATALAWQSAFWLGMLDGDGTITLPKTRPPRVHFIGQPTLMQQCSKWLARLHIRISPNRTHGLWCVAPSGVVAQRVVRTMYGSSPVWLPRKRLRADAVLAWRSRIHDRRPERVEYFTLPCVQCHSPIRRSAQRLAKSMQAFCDRRCWYAWHANDLKERAHTPEKEAVD
jgi:hypothetical protein